MSDVRAGELIAESLRAAAARPFKFLATVLLALLPLTGVVLLEVLDANALEQVRSESIRSGSNVIIVSNDGAPFDGESCSQATQISTVVRGGQIYETSAARIRDFPTVPVQFAVVSPGAMTVIDPEIEFSTDGTFVIGDAIRSELSLQAGSPIRLDSGLEGTVGAVDQNTERALEQSRWVYRLEARPTNSPVLQCWLEVSAGKAKDLAGSLPALFTGLESLKISTMGSTDPLIRAEARYAERATKYAWLPGGLFLGMISVIALLGRRAEYAIFATTGFSRAERALMCTVEYWVVAVTATLVSVGIMLSTQLLLGGSLVTMSSLAALNLLLVLTAGAVVHGLLAPIVWGADVARALKNRD